MYDLLLLALLLAVAGLSIALLVTVVVAWCVVRSARSAVVGVRKPDDLQRAAERLLPLGHSMCGQGVTAEARIILDTEPHKPLTFTWNSTSAMRDNAHLN